HLIVGPDGRRRLEPVRNRVHRDDTLMGPAGRKFLGQQRLHPRHLTELEQATQHLADIPRASYSQLHPPTTRTAEVDLCEPEPGAPDDPGTAQPIDHTGDIESTGPTADATVESFTTRDGEADLFESDDESDTDTTRTVVWQPEEPTTREDGAQLILREG